MAAHKLWRNPSYAQKQQGEDGLHDKAAPVFAIIAAAGSGSRMGLTQNKQFLKIDGVPVIVRCVAALQACRLIRTILVVAAEEECRLMADLLYPEKFSRLLAVTAGGTTRQASVAAGLAALQDEIDPPGDSPILVHDGARCFVTASVVERVIAGIRRYGACGAAVPVKDTIRVVDDSGRVLATPERSRLQAMQTPQGATWQIMSAAYRQATKKGSRSTDDLAVLEEAGHPVHLVMGDYANLKLTTPDDLRYAEWLAEKRGQ